MAARWHRNVFALHLSRAHTITKVKDRVVVLCDPNGVIGKIDLLRQNIEVESDV